MSIKAKNSAAEVLKKYQAAKATPATPSGTKPAQLVALWNKAVPQHHEGVKYVKPFTAKDYGMLKSITSLWGADTDKVLLTLITEWIGFTKYTVKVAGAFKTPLEPTLSFILRYAGQGMNFHLQQTPSCEKTGMSPTAVTVSSNYSGKTDCDSGPPTVVKKNAHTVQLTAPKVAQTKQGDVLSSDEDDGPVSLATLLEYKAKQHALKQKSGGGNA